MLCDGNGVEQTGLPCGSGFVQNPARGSGFRVQGSGCRVQGVGLRERPCPFGGSTCGRPACPPGTGSHLPAPARARSRRISGLEESATAKRRSRKILLLREGGPGKPAYRISPTGTCDSAVQKNQLLLREGGPGASAYRARSSIIRVQDLACRHMRERGPGEYFP